MPTDHHFQIHGEKWLIRFTRLRGQAAGWAYLSDQKNPRLPRKILIDESLAGRRRLEIIIHECMHVCHPTVDEQHITDSAKDIAKILWSLGYRLTEE